MTDRSQNNADEPTRNVATSTQNATQDFHGRQEQTRTFHGDAEQDSRDAAAVNAGGTFGRYRTARILGEGGFGVVYLARDDELDRWVAIKVPRPQRLSSPGDIEAYLIEARTIAKLEHPGIVPVYDVGRAEDVPYVVSKFVDGEDLQKRIQRSGLTIREASALIATLAETLDFVHGRGVVHRDIKPGNVLLDREGTPFLTDFGLALRDAEFGKGSTWAGTPSYMSPEQARGESHLVDGRSDVFSLGVLLYELLTGSKPFQAGTIVDLVEQIVRAETPSLRQKNHAVPKELERICQKALAKRSWDRYETAGRFAEDLRCFLREYEPLHERGGVSPRAASASPVGAVSSRGLAAIVPRGLRSYEEDDAHFFHTLLPGPRDRNGLPDSIAFWKSRIEETDPDRSFRVGLVYGPSGCGKSSFMKAGLLPVLADNVHTAFLEASPGQTEVRLLNALKSQCPLLPPDLDLPQALSSLRRGHGLSAGRKMLIVIDQFEQWLYSEPDQANSKLATALRQCDGRHVQCILLVRDDFWLAVSRFMDHLEIELVQNRNMALVDLFDRPHARRVLAELGKGYGRLPGHLDEFSDAQERFLNEAVDGLAQDDRIIPVRLALFAEMIKARDWTPATLKRLGGIAGVGRIFFEETFGSSTAPVEYRGHRDAVRETLRALLPDAGSDIKGHMRSHAELLKASGYDSHPRDFERLLSILDGELRLITPTNREGDDGNASDSSRESGATERYFQLTHDYLVPAIREWITLRQKQTARGRAELALSERAELWDRKREARNLPSFPEWLRVFTLTRRRLWTSPQRDMMRAATKRYTLLSAVFLMVLGVVLTGTWWVRGQARANALIDQLTTAQDSELASLIDELRKRERWSRAGLDHLRDDGNPRTRLLASLALLEWEPELAEPVTEELLKERVSPVTLRAAMPYLQPVAGRVRPLCWQRLETAEGPDAEGQRFHAAMLLAGIDPPASETNQSRWKKYAGFISERLIQESADNRQYHTSLVDLIRPAQSEIVSVLHRVLVDDGESELRRNSAAGLLRDMLADRPGELAVTFLDARVQDIRKALPILDENKAEIAPVLARAVSETYPSGADDAAKDTSALRRSTAAALLARHGGAEFVPGLLMLSTDPAPRTYLIDRLEQLGAPVETVLAALEQQSDVSIRAALLQTLGQFSRAKLKTEHVEAALEQFRQAFLDRCHPELHASAEWALLRWNEGEWVRDQYKRISAETRSPEGVSWYVNAEGHVMVRVVPDKASGLAPFEVAAQETTVAQFLRFQPVHVYDKVICPAPDCPVGGVTWYAAADYCRWLTAQEKLGEAEMAFAEVSTRTGKSEMLLVEDYRNRRGYRLLTQAEWVYLHKCGAASPSFLGWSRRMMTRYDAIEDNARGRTWPAGTFKPSPHGLFGLFANIGEWCADGGEDEKGKQKRIIYTDSYKIPLPLTHGIMESNDTTPELYWYSIGFRVARSTPTQSR